MSSKSTRPKRKLPADHYRHIADLKEYFGRYYGVPIAELYGVPVRTVHRWVYEATLMGVLHKKPPACPTCKRPYDRESSS